LLQSAVEIPPSFPERNQPVHSNKYSNMEEGLTTCLLANQTEGPKGPKGAMGAMGAMGAKGAKEIR